MAQSDVAGRDERAKAAGGAVAAAERGPSGESLGLDAEGLAALRESVRAWRAGPVAKAAAALPPRAERFTTWSG
ncbi:MAG: methylmalonyl-CoA mutase, partial [Polyangiaceae bacterium]|nr:methylmalonyl-CoA mutase [Polyangiaceae bacterium]